MIWTWPQIALSYCELRLKPHPLIQFYFSFFYYLFCEGWHIRLCISRMASNFFFAALGLTWIKCVAHVSACVCVCEVCVAYVAWMHTTWNLPCLWIFWICKVTQEREWEEPDRMYHYELLPVSYWKIILTNCMICLCFLNVFIFIFNCMNYCFCWIRHLE